MLETTGNLWDFVRYGWLVIPTSLEVRADGLGDLLVGVVDQPASEVRGLRRYYGAMLREGRRGVEPLVMVGPEGTRRLVFLPMRQPGCRRASLALTRRSAAEMASNSTIRGQVFLPSFGDELGVIDGAAVCSVLGRELPDDRFILVSGGERSVEAFPRRAEEWVLREAVPGWGAA